jgi:hypothetical protein
MDSKIIDRVKKLLALSQSPNEHEAAAAAAQASRLMREHDIAESMLDTSDEPQPLQLGEEVIEDGARLATWKANIASGIAAANGCHLFTKRSGDKTALTMFGKPNAIATSRYMFAYLVATVERLAHASGGVSTKWRNGFKLGCAHTIYTRLLADKREHEAQVKQSGASASAALVRVQTDADRIKAAFNARTAGFSKGRKATSRVDHGAYTAGRDAGSTINLSTGRAALGAPSERLRA